MLLKEGKKGQVTIFIIVAILIIAIGVLIWQFYPKLKSTISPETKNPHSFIQECLEEEIEDVVKTLSLQGGSIDAGETNSYLYKGDYVKYLCYSNEYWEACINQEPFLREHIESEILNEISDDIVSCFDFLEQSYLDKGYTVELTLGETKVDILPNRISTNLEHELVLTKGESEKYDSFYVILDNNLYELLDIAINIIAWEIDIGDSLPEVYMTYDPYIKVEKKREDDETRVYIIRDRKTEDFFQFAIRSWATPPGYT